MADSSATPPLGGLLSDPQFWATMGMGVMASGRYGGNLGEGLMQGLNTYYQSKQAGQTLQKGQFDLARQRLMMNAAQQEFGGQAPPQGGVPMPPPPPPQAPQGPPAPPPGGIPPGMPGAVGGPSPAAPQAQAAPQTPPFLQPPSQQDIYSTQVPGLPSAGYIRGSAILGERNPMPELDALRTAQLKQKQQEWAPRLAKIDNIVNGANPVQFMQSDDEMRQGWPLLAQRLGYDPVTDLNDKNVRAAFAYGGNAVRSALSMPTEKPVVPDETVNGPLGSIYQRKPVTGELKQVKGEEGLHQVIGDDGKPVLVTASEARGRQPFNASVFGAANATDQAIQFAADTYRTTGKFPGAFGRNPMLQAKVLDKVASDAAAANDTAGSIAARQASLKANGQALDQTTKMESATTSYYKTMDMNLKKLEELAGKVDSSGSPLINRVYRAWQQGVKGDPSVAQYVTYLNSVQSEFAKISSGSLGNAPVSDAARGHANEIINKFMSQGQISAVADAMRTEGNNRLQSLRDQLSELNTRLGAVAPGGKQPARPGQAVVGLPSSADIDAELARRGAK